MTKIIPIAEMGKYREEILETFRSGGVVLYPTDTQYGLGVIARDREAVEKIHAIKKTDKPVSVIVPDIASVEKYVFVNDAARKLMQKYLPGALTLILPAKDKEFSENLGNSQEIGVRIPDKKEILDIVRELGEPITTTSANIYGQEPATNCRDILKVLSGIDLAIDGGEAKTKASTIVQFSGEDFKVIRQGNVDTSAE